MLLLARGRQVPVGVLIDGLWEQEAPRSAASTVRTYVSRLRRLLAASAVAAAGRRRGAGACLAVARASPADGLQDACRYEIAQVALRLLEAEALGVLVAQPPGTPGHRDVMQRGDDTLV